MERGGRATLPLHSGSAPRRLFDRMVDLGGAIAELIVRDHGRSALVRRLADPYWFQAFGCVLGFDWHSSGVTTTTMGALKEALDPADLGVCVVGGKGATSRRTPDELDEAPLGLSGQRRETLQRTSRLSAAVDHACLQDGYELYHHAMVVTEDGDWCVVQQGMGETTARRYHWCADDVDRFVSDPRSAICAQDRRSTVLDLSASASDETRAVSLDLVRDDPSRLKRYIEPADQRSLAAFGGGVPAIGAAAEPDGPHLRLPMRHELTLDDLTERSVEQLQRAYEVQPSDYEELVETEGVGAKSLRALALIAELVHDAESAREDPAKYAYAHGGKDGTPAPVDRGRYDRSIAEMRAVLEGAEVDGETKQSALDRLSELE
jgi:hypothetical protein